MEVAVPEPVRFVPGQFAMLSGWPGSDPLLPRPFAIFRTTSQGERNTVEFVYKVVGRGTALLSGLHDGDPVSVTLPLGRGYDLSGEGRVFWLVGGGVGFSTVFPAADALAHRKGEFELYLGGRSRDQLPPKGWTPGGEILGRVHLCTDDGTAGFHGTLVDALRERMLGMSATALSRVTILACGPRPMLKGLAALAEEHGIPLQVSLENHMACGFGVCWGCVTALHDQGAVAYRRVCKEGPVFDAKEVVW
ncbi:MAG TPA: dihydroorotate dehydrogenase electron transfer subunit [Candidatus Deferrimicrobiaceae bacterium]